MSQKLRNSTLDALLRSEPQVNSIFKREKRANSTTRNSVREKSSTRSKNVAESRINPKTKQTSIKSKTSTRPKTPKELALKGTDNLENILKPHKHKQENLGFKRDRGETWANTLKQTADQTFFSNFDPLRSLHFLVKELELKVQKDLPDDRYMEQMVCNMLSALKRVPPEVASTIRLYPDQESLKTRSRSRSRSNVNKNYDKELKVLKKKLSDKSSQTPFALASAEADHFRQEMENSTAKLEASCRQMEQYCERLRGEKMELEQRLAIEKERTSLLQTQVGDLQEENQVSEARVRELKQQRDDLQSQVTKLTTIIDEQAGQQQSEEIRDLITRLRKEKEESENRCAHLQKTLAMAELEKEKLSAMLKVRENQVTEIKTEMGQLQDVINQQLMGMQINMPSDSFFESLTTMADTNIDGNRETGDSNAMSSITTEEPTINDNKVVRNLAVSSFRELPSGDSSASILQHSSFLSKSPPTKDKPAMEKSKVKEKTSDITTKLSKHPNIPYSLKSIFEELKREVSSVADTAYNNSKSSVNDVITVGIKDKKP